VRKLSDLQDLADGVVLITGGAGHLGRTMAGTMLQMGAAVALVDRAASVLERAAEILRDIYPERRIAIFETDLESGSAREKLFSQFTQQFSRLDVLINNAGFVGDTDLQGWAVEFEAQSIETWRRAIEVNLTAPFHLAQLFAPLLRANGAGSIINISSIYGMLGPDLSLYDGTVMGNPAAYAASKGGLLQLTRWLATVMAPDVRVNSITPGGLERGQPEAFAKRYVAKTPMARMGSEEDFIGAAAFLASDASRWVTGQNIVVDGGWTAW
jgi:NAD(P)-dependent dehydrogenase (short-subunit alcohol dehydrogenase family)